MRKFWCIVMVMVAVTASASARMAELMPDDPAAVRTSSSDNGRYEVTVRPSGSAFATWSLKEDGKELWSQPLDNEPVEAEISDNGEVIILPTWGWRDEGGSSGIAVYNKKGELVKEIPFKGDTPNDDILRWVKTRKLSPEGKFVAIGESGKEAARATVFNALTGDIVWTKSGGYPDMAAVKISNQGTFTLVATKQVSDMDVRLYDAAGAVLWEKKLPGNFSYDVKKYLRFTDDGTGFEVFDLKAGKYTSEKIPEKKP